MKICDVKFIFSSANDNFHHKIEIEAAIHYRISYRESKRISGFNLWFFHLCHIIVIEHLMHDKLFVEYYFFDLDIRNGSVCFVSYLRKQLPLLLRDFRIKNYVSRITHYSSCLISESLINEQAIIQFQTSLVLYSFQRRGIFLDDMLGSFLHTKQFLCIHFKAHQHNRIC